MRVPYQNYIRMITTPKERVKQAIKELETNFRIAISRSIYFCSRVSQTLQKGFSFLPEFALDLAPLSFYLIPELMKA